MSLLTEFDLHFKGIRENEYEHLAMPGLGSALARLH